MASPRTNFAVGLFMITGIAFITAVIIFVGAANYLRTGLLYSAYFNESVQGLSKDSPVKFRGVSVGRVHDIQISGDARLIEVILRIESDWKPDDAVIAQLKSIGITGIMFIELDVREEFDVVILPDPEAFSNRPVIPTKQSEVRQLLSGVADVVQQIRAIDIDGLFKKMEQTITAIDDSVRQAGINELTASLQAAVDKADNFLDESTWNELLTAAEDTGRYLNQFSRKADYAADQINVLLADNQARLTDAIHNFQTAMRHADQMIAGGSFLMDRADESMTNMEKRLETTIRYLEEAGRNLSRLTAKGAGQPSQLLFATPLEEKKLDTDD